MGRRSWVAHCLRFRTRPYTLHNLADMRCTTLDAKRGGSQVSHAFYLPHPPRYIKYHALRWRPITALR